MSQTPSHAQIFFVFSPSPALLAMIPQATPVPQLPSLAQKTVTRGSDYSDTIEASAIQSY